LTSVAKAEVKIDKNTIHTMNATYTGVVRRFFIRCQQKIFDLSR